MLRNMFVGSPPGNHDRILDFSTPTTGSLFFVPGLELLESLPPPEGTRAPEDLPSQVAGADGSLGIGSLK